MIKTDPKPHRKVEYYNGTIQLDQEYTFEVSKSTNGETKYEVINIQPYLEDSIVEELISKTIINHCTREGLGQIENK